MASWLFTLISKVTIVSTSFELSVHNKLSHDGNVRHSNCACSYRTDCDIESIVNNLIFKLFSAWEGESFNGELFLDILKNLFLWHRCCQGLTSIAKYWIGIRERKLLRCLITHQIFTINRTVLNLFHILSDFQKAWKWKYIIASLKISKTRSFRISISFCANLCIVDCAARKN